MKLLLLIVFIELYRQCSGYHVKDVLPFLVKIKAKTDSRNLDCAGTILGPQVVLTSAHCVDGFRASEVSVIHMTPTQVNVYETALVIINPSYKRTRLENDIALLQTQTPFMKPWVAVKINDLLTQPKCSYLQIVGWAERSAINGTKSLGTGVEDRPMIAPVELISNSNCTSLIRSFGGTFHGKGKLCAVSNDDGECFTGPGGPLLCSEPPKPLENETSVSTTTEITKSTESYKNETLGDPIDLLATLEQSETVYVKREATSDPIVQVGVVSWGKSCSQVPIIYVRTDMYQEWIAEHMKYIARKNGTKTPQFTFLTPLKGAGTSFHHRLPLLTNAFSLIVVTAFYLICVRLWHVNL